MKKTGILLAGFLVCGLSLVFFWRVEHEGGRRPHPNVEQPNFRRPTEKTGGEKMPSQPTKAGKIYTFRVCQDSGGDPICNFQQFYSDGTDAIGLGIVNHK